MLQPMREFPEYTVVMITLWPNLIIQLQSNTFAMRQLGTRKPGEFERARIFSGDAGDSEAVKFSQAGCVRIFRSRRHHGNGRTRLEG
jgi:hypothetical protein